MTISRTITVFSTLAILCGCCANRCSDSASATAHVKPRHVILVGFDGLAGDQVGRAHTPTMDRLMAEGAWTLDARSMLPASSACNWHSMFTAATVEQHGYNAWDSMSPAFPPIETAENGLYPDVFYMLRKHRPNAEIGLAYEWDGIAHCLDTNACSFVQQGNTESLTATACDYIKAKRPTFLAVCYNDPDTAGHTKGWGSPEYLANVEMLDACLAKILRAIEDSKIKDETVVIVTSDHGGCEKSHGRAQPSDMNRPMLIAGKGVAKGRHLAFPGAIYDTGATIAALLGLPPAKSWIGRPYDEAFAP